jgi:SAM-dependent methyltransferase
MPRRTSPGTNYGWTVASRPGRWRGAWRRLAQSVIFRAPGERNDCPACGSTDLFDLDVLPLRAGRTGFVCGCDGCGLVFSNPLAGSDELSEFYTPSGSWHGARQAEERPGLPGHGAGKWARVFDPIRAAIDVTAPPPGSAVLDFGCGEGKLLDALQSRGWVTSGIEPAIDRAFTRHRRLHAVPESPAFDLVIAAHVLEHVPNPLQVLRQLAAACRTGGHLLVGVPRFDTLARHRDYRYVMNGRAHITAYTWPCLSTLLARAGWEAVAPPADEVKKGGGRLTASRMRVLARRVDTAAAGSDAPGAAARAALRAYYAIEDARPLAARMGWLRLAARRADRARQRDKSDRKAARRRTASRQDAA